MSENAISEWEEEAQDPKKAIVFNARMHTDDGSVRCLVCGSELQYITHSHMVTHPHGPTTIEEYKSMVSGVLDIPREDVPVMSADLADRLAEKTTKAWEDGEYDHFRIEG